MTDSEAAEPCRCSLNDPTARAEFVAAPTPGLTVQGVMPNRRQQDARGPRPVRSTNTMLSSSLRSSTGGRLPFGRGGSTTCQRSSETRGSFIRPVCGSLLPSARGQVPGSGQSGTQSGVRAHGWFREMARYFLAQTIHGVELMLNRAQASAWRTLRLTLIGSQSVATPQMGTGAKKQARGSSGMTSMVRVVQTGGSRGPM